MVSMAAIATGEVPGSNPGKGDNDKILTIRKYESSTYKLHIEVQHVTVIYNV